MSYFRVLVTAAALAITLGGCGRYEAGNSDRERCETLRPGMTYEQIVAVMGQPKQVQPLADFSGRILKYGEPAMRDLPMFSADKAVEIVVVSSSAGLLL